MIDLNPDLIKKMKFKEGNRLIVINKEKVHKPSPIGGIITTNEISEADRILLFADSTSSLQSSFLKILKSICKETILWIAYPKKSSGIKTDLDRDHGWEILSKNGYEGVALISLNDLGLRFALKKPTKSKKEVLKRKNKNVRNYPNTSTTKRKS